MKTKEIIWQDNEDENKTNINTGCPCVNGYPCHERCTCLNPTSSWGCRYGSKEQRRAKAQWIYNIISEHDKQIGQMTIM